MDYRFKMNEEIFSVEVEKQSAENVAVRIGEKRLNIDFAAVGENQIHLNINGRRINAFVCDQDDGKQIVINGKSYFVQDADLLEQTRTRKKGLISAATEVTPPMPAVVISILVAENDVVEKGQALIVVSAMKMETTLTAPFDGSIAKINVAEGDKVMPGQVLVDIQK